VSKSNEEKFATVVSNLISDLRFDLDLAGKYLAWYLPNVAFRRFMLIAEAAKEEREGKTHERDNIRE
jgi:hypothetical protein